MMASTMRSLVVTNPGTVSLEEIPVPECGPADIVIAPRACGICGTDLFFLRNGGAADRLGRTPLGHEIAGEVVEMGASVQGFAVGDHVVVNPMAEVANTIGCGGPTGGLAERLLIPGAIAGKQVRVIPKSLPWEVAALNEPMAVARHGVNRSEVRPGETVVIFGAGPIGLGAVIGFHDRDAGNVVVVDVHADRLKRALDVGADAVINATTEDVAQRLRSLHGKGRDGVGGLRVGTDIFLDAAGAPEVIDQVIQMAKWGAVLVVVGVHQRPVEIDLRALLVSELQIRPAMGYPEEIFSVTDSILRQPERYAKIISDTFEFDEVQRAIELAGDRAASGKVMVLLPDMKTL